MTVEDFICLLGKYVTVAETDGPFFSDLAPNTVRNYKTGAKNIVAAMTAVPGIYNDRSATFTPAMAQAIVDSMIDINGPGAAKCAVGTMGSILSYKILYTDMSHDTYNPFDYVKIPDGEQIPAWTPAQIADHMGIVTPFVPLLVSLLFETAQRFGDVLRINHSMITYDPYADINFIAMTQQKTGTTVKIPIPEDLRDRLRHISKNYDMNDGQSFLSVCCEHPLEKSQNPEALARYCYSRIAKACGIQPLPLHGLRKSAVIRMIAAGATEYEIMAITGHKSSSSLKSYVGEYDKDAAAKAAIEKVSAYGR